ncbi:TIGR03085 family metal-binding protein [Streptomyces xiaopingdaonensis]|uniref:TIGR03085 family metal-binding protein n=1 Tax=Streptomyces xiaopingdaonensis TaxID=1565415 RepID=UPI0002DBDB41|nr:TIGR03085 family metal-binding protein [Streptomyces xiaopingdaonensis]
MSTHAQRERLLLADLLENHGPDAPTLCGDWRTRDLAAHLLVRERRGDAAAGSFVKQLQPRMERVQAEFAERPYEELLGLFRSGPPRSSPFAIKQIDEAANTVEFFIHAEDVRRAEEDWKPRQLDAVFQDVLWRRLEKAARVLARKSPVGLVLRRPDGQTVVARKGTPVVTVTAEPSELLLYTSGRQRVAKVEAAGDNEAVARAETADLSF